MSCLPGDCKHAQVPRSFTPQRSGATHRALSNIRLKTVAGRSSRSRTVAAFYTEKAREIVSELEKRGYVIAGGVGELKDKAIRVGVMGEVALEDLKAVVEVANSYAGW